MRRKALLTLALASVLALAGCTQKEVTKVDPLNIPIEETEPVKPAEPIVINVVPELEAEENDNNIEISADIDYYGKEEATQPAPSSPNSGFEASTPSTWNPNEEWKGGGNGMPTTRRSGGDWSAGGTW
jgi:hypothetical protein